MPKPQILQVAAYPDFDMPALRENFILHQLFDAADPDALLRQHAQEIRAIATRGDVGASADLINALPNLEIIAVHGVGYDSVDLAAARLKRIPVTNTPDVLTGDCADFAIGILLACARRIPEAQEWAKTGKWQSQGPFPLSRRVFGSKIGILGMGRIGSAIARRCEGFDVSVGYCNRSPRENSQQYQYFSNPVDLAAWSDFLIVTLTGGTETRHIVDRTVLEALGPDGMLVNISRSSNVDEGALLDALETGTIGSAALDVFDGEPEINPRFLALENVLLQPHVASATEPTRKEMGQLMLKNLLAHFENAPLITPVE